MRIRASIVALLLPVAILAGQTYQGGGLYAFPRVTGVGVQNALPIDYKRFTASPSQHTLDWTVTGTAPSSCTIELRGSSDNITWYSLTGPFDCTASGMTHVTSKAVALIQVNVLTYTAGDGTTLVVPHYTRGSAQ